MANFLEIRADLEEIDQREERIYSALGWCAGHGEDLQKGLIHLGNQLNTRLFHSTQTSFFRTVRRVHEGLGRVDESSNRSNGWRGLASAQENAEDVQQIVSRLGLHDSSNVAAQRLSGLVQAQAKGLQVVRAAFEQTREEIMGVTYEAFGRAMIDSCLERVTSGIQGCEEQQALANNIRDAAHDYQVSL